MMMAGKTAVESSGCHDALAQKPTICHVGLLTNKDQLNSVNVCLCFVYEICRFPLVHANRSRKCQQPIRFGFVSTSYALVIGRTWIRSADDSPGDFHYSRLVRQAIPFG